MLIPFAASALLAACGASDTGHDNVAGEVASGAENPANTPGEQQGAETGGSQQGTPTTDQALPPNTGAEPPEEPAIEEPVVGGLPIDPNADPAGGTALNLNELLTEENCATGWLPNGAEGPEAPEEKTCAATFRGICFTNDAKACECAGCGNDSCQIAESYPTQISCASIALGCNFIWFDACFETAEQACDAAGCAAGKCVIAESFPAQVRCE